MIASNCAAVSFSGSTITGGAGLPGPDTHHGLFATNSSVSLWGCTVTGGSGNGDLLGGGGAGVLLIGGSLFASGSTFTGGAGADGYLEPPFNLCTDGMDGGDGLVLFAGAPVARLRASTTAAGAGGAPGDATCLPGQPGSPSVVVSGALIELPGTHRSMEIFRVIREGGVSPIELQGADGDLAWLFLGPTVAHTFELGLLGTLLPGPPLFAIPAGTLPAGGKKLLTPFIGELGPGIEGITLYEQPLFFEPASTLVLLGTPRVAVFVDAAF